MKRVLFAAVILCIFPFCCIASTNDELNYLWGIRIGSPITEAVSDFEKNTGFELEPPTLKATGSTPAGCTSFIRCFSSGRQRIFLIYS